MAAVAEIRLSTDLFAFVSSLVWRDMAVCPWHDDCLAVIVLSQGSDRLPGQHRKVITGAKLRARRLSLEASATGPCFLQSSLAASRPAPPSPAAMAEALYSSGKHGLATEPGSLAGAVLRRLLLSESDLPEGIQFLPALFRLMAFLLFLPVAMLTLVRLGSGLPARALWRGA